jgi:hypothetical protein
MWVRSTVGGCRGRHSTFLVSRSKSSPNPMGHDRRPLYLEDLKTPKEFAGRIDSHMMRPLPGDDPLC